LSGAGLAHDLPEIEPLIGWPKSHAKTRRRVRPKRTAEASRAACLSAEVVLIKGTIVPPMST
jgi:hypothetical protein